ncbi:hypothetical protein [Janthinobacterium sp. FT14W]|nr:hypothetical protein [Janthinobacterium sp. FT14W]
MAEGGGIAGARQRFLAAFTVGPASGHMPPRLRVFIDFMVEQLQDRTFGA